MPEWLRSAMIVETTVSPSTMLVRLLIAAAFGALIALTYRLSHGRLAREAHTLVGTLVLLTILLAMVTMVIGDSVARAFGLVGALSIVRFRTIVEDTRDTAFVIFAVVVGMAVGTGLAWVAVVGVPVVAAAAIGLSLRTPAVPSALLGDGAITLAIRLGAGHTPEPIAALLADRTRAWRLTGVTTARQGAAMDLTYAVTLADDAAAPALVTGLNALPGVQSIDLRTAARAD